MKRLSPASWFRSHHNPVRLACVKHAASVHPEPGSNSRKKVQLRFAPQNCKFVLRPNSRVVEVRFTLFDSGNKITLASLVSVILFVAFRSCFSEILLNFQGCITVCLSRFNCPAVFSIKHAALVYYHNCGPPSRVF